MSGWESVGPDGDMCLTPEKRQYEDELNRLPRQSRDRVRQAWRDLRRRTLDRNH